MSRLTKYRRVEQWQVFARTWYLYDCKWQDPFDSAFKISAVLRGAHKPIYENNEDRYKNQDYGDHVVCINTKEIAMPQGEWKWRHYYHHTMYAKGKTWAPAWDLHMKDPTIVMYKACYKACNIGDNAVRRNCIARLHLFADDNVPDHIKINITDQLTQAGPVYKRLEEYSQEEIKQFPLITDYPDDYVVK